MSKKITRRSFVISGAATGLIAAKPGLLSAKSPTIITGNGVKPVVISSANGNRFKNGGDVTCVQKAFAMITSGGDVLDALIAGVNIVELDPLDDSVGYGGLPNAEGIVQLDSCCMHGPKKRAGGVASIEGVRTPSLVAKAVMEQTDHHLIVGKDAQAFARSVGFKIEDDLNTEHSRKVWLEWKRRTDPNHYLDPTKRAEAGHRVALEMVAEGKIDREHLYGTINCDGVSPNGDVDRKSTRLNSSHVSSSYAVFCLKKKNRTRACPYPSSRDSVHDSACHRRYTRSQSRLCSYFTALCIPALCCAAADRLCGSCCTTY